MSDSEPKKCIHKVRVRDTYRYCGGKKHFELCYKERPCRRHATDGEYCYQHAPTRCQGARWVLNQRTKDRTHMLVQCTARADDGSKYCTDCALRVAEIMQEANIAK